MAEEKVLYDIQIDQESLAQQLEQVRNQIDLTMGASALSPGPSAQSVQQLPQSGVFAAPDVSQQGFMDNMMASLDQASQYTQLGFTKFQQDARRLGLLADSSYPNYQTGADVYGQGPSGFFSGVAGLFNTSFGGFDRDRSGMTMGDFRDKAISRIIEGVSPMENDMLFTGLGGAAGLAFGGLGGGLIGVGVGGGMDLVNSIAGMRIRERESLEDGIKQIALQSFGGIPSSSAQRMAQSLQDTAYSFEGRSLGMDLDVMQENLATFANAGGFSNVTSADEMQNVMEGLVQNARRFANNFKMKQQEAVQVMAQLSQSMVVDPEDFGNFSSDINAFSQFTGINPADAVSYGLQGVNMLKGMGIGAESSFNMTMEARMQAERLRRADPETRQIINDLGGPDQYAIAQLETGVRYMSSGAGLLSAGALLGGSGFGSTSDMLSGAAQFFGSDPLNMFRVQSELPGVMKALGAEGMQAMQMNNVYNIARASGMTDSSGNIDRAAITGLASQVLGISTQEASGMVAGYIDTRNRDAVDDFYRDFINRSQNRAAENETTLGGLISATIGEKITNPLFENYLNPIGEAFNSLGESIEYGLTDIVDYMNGNVRVRPLDMTNLDKQIAQGDLSNEQMKKLERMKSEAKDRYAAGPTTKKEFLDDLPADLRSRVLADPISGGNLPGRGIDGSTAFELFGGLDSDEVKSIFLNELGPGSELSADDLKYFRTASRLSNTRASRSAEEVLMNADVRANSSMQYLSVAASALGAGSFSELDPGQQKAALNAAQSYGFGITRDQMELGNRLRVGQNRANTPVADIDAEAMNAELDNQEESLIEKVRGFITPGGPASMYSRITSPDSEIKNLINATADYRINGKKTLDEVASEYGIEREQLTKMVKAYGKESEDLVLNRSIAQSAELRSQSKELAALYEGSNANIQKLTDTYLGFLKQNNLGGEQDLVAKALSLPEGINLEDLSQAEKSQMLREQITAGADKIVRGEMSYRDIPEGMQNLLKNKMEDYKMELYTKLNTALEEGIKVKEVD